MLFYLHYLSDVFLAADSSTLIFVIIIIIIIIAVA